MLTAQQNVELPLLLTNLNKKERAERTAIALGVVGLADRMDHYPRQLSGGQEQRVAIARAIVADPTLILLDEPTGQLDAKSSDEVLELLRRLNEEFHKTIMMVTHDAKAADRAKTVLHLEKGVLLEREAVKASGGIARRRSGRWRDEIPSARSREPQAPQAAHDPHDRAASRWRSSCSRRSAPSSTTLNAGSRGEQRVAHDRAERDRVRHPAADELRARGSSPCRTCRT